ncbi:23S rRNA (uracil(1939)-C(5))-methyltransferase RlmD [Lactobacillus sp. LC28-10]|uniref:23S rRNA (Uracil(1939)-C(5))-methyltransferase RlmD n=1 Tax=Secundilactobacillus angelensis TaxID=2722706 RepID=A0ABX1KZ68_9LACO|nr:23S rRNA (uracil(1939)-C(5))-methyltransferase RlmD [Secundilactobacillus angelensis]MCH5462536.1 23S rRNA (uracil(1939)-C(5))-methyltransferase RlmD [Secundilactobacillus angelensis]NLR18273.1 23S rRNA (uracil(1939)-C(5))-methyltransferase RlmD [Secundilactobacillus angelensis]
MKIQAPVAKNETYTGTVMDLTYEGNGVVKIDNYSLFIANALPGEEIKFVVTKVGKSFGFGRVLEHVTTSPDRAEIDAKDRKLAQAGIAPLQHMVYPAQLRFKQHQIESLLAKNKLDLSVSETIGMETPYHYRNKAQIPVRMVNGQLETGFYRQHSHDLVPLTDFYIQDPRIDKAIVIVRDILRAEGIPAYDERTHKGIIRNVMVRQSYYEKEMMVGLITNSHTLPRSKEIVAQISEQLPEVTSIIQNVNNRPTNVILGPITNVLYGEPVIHDSLLGNRFEISAQSFYQVNPVQTEKLYQLAIDRAGLTGQETVIDAYCGIGTISLAMARHAKEVYGVEVVSTAVEDAKKNAKLNELTNLHFETNKAEYQMAEWQKQGLKPDVIVVDPPRKGLDETLIHSAAAMQPKKVVYVSCNPSTLVRDIQRFAEEGYHVTEPIQPVDQFPQTPHIESVTLLEKD